MKWVYGIWNEYLIGKMSIWYMKWVSDIKNEYLVYASTTFVVVFLLLVNNIQIFCKCGKTVMIFVVFLVWYTLSKRFMFFLHFIYEINQIKSNHFNPTEIKYTWIFYLWVVYEIYHPDINKVTTLCQKKIPLQRSKSRNTIQGS